MNRKEITIGTRKSKLALVQSHYVRDLLTARYPDITVNVKHIVTKGDKIIDVPLSKIGDKGLFTKELENALLQNEADLAVHSYKDLPTKLPAGLIVGVVMKRVPNNDVLIAKPGTSLANLPKGARVGTSSLRRRVQLINHRPDLEVMDLRGNVNTRIEKLLEGQYDAIVLARAGVMRMDLEQHVAEIFPLDVMIPAVGQGALGIEVRENDAEIIELLSFLDDRDTRAATAAERAFLEALEGGCQVPIGATGVVDGDSLTLRGFAASLDGSTFFRGEETGSAASPAEIGKKLAERLISQGADKVLEEIRAAQTALEEKH